MSQIKLKNFQISCAMKGIEGSYDDFIASVLRSRWFCEVFGCSRTRLALIDSGDYRRRRVPHHCFS